MIDPRLLSLINKFFNLIYIISLSILAGYIIYLGILYIISPSTDKVKEIHKRWKFIIIGAVIIFLSLTIPLIIDSFFRR